MNAAHPAVANCNTTSAAMASFFIPDILAGESKGKECAVG